MLLKSVNLCLSLINRINDKLKIQHSNICPNRKFCVSCNLEKPFRIISFFPLWIHLPPLFQVNKGLFEDKQKSPPFNVDFHLSSQPRIAADEKKQTATYDETLFLKIGFWIKNKITWTLILALLWIYYMASLVLKLLLGPLAFCFNNKGSFFQF